MEYRELGRTGVKVSALTLGTMTYGEQNTEAEGHAQMDYAVDRGINIFDAAEIYPIPPKAETQGATESVIGTWLASRKSRDKVMIATKVAGRSTVIDWLRDEPMLRGKVPRRCAMRSTSLGRLRTDYVDLYQLTGRTGAVFEGLEYERLPGDATAPRILEALGEFVASGKVRFVASPETPWGVMSFLRLAGARPRAVSIRTASTSSIAPMVGLSRSPTRSRSACAYSARPGLFDRQVRRRRAAAGSPKTLFNRPPTRGTDLGLSRLCRARQKHERSAQMISHAVSGPS